MAIRESERKAHQLENLTAYLKELETQLETLKSCETLQNHPGFVLLSKELADKVKILTDQVNGNVELLLTSDRSDEEEKIALKKTQRLYTEGFTTQAILDTVKNCSKHANDCQIQIDKTKEEISKLTELGGQKNAG